MLSAVTLTVLFSIISIDAKCVESFVHFCDNLSDLKGQDIETWYEVVIGNEKDDASKLKRIDYDSIMLDQFDKLKSLTIIRQIKDIKTYTFTGEPDEYPLDYIKLYKNEIKRIRSSTFDTLRLKNLILKNNSIEYLHKEAFYNSEIQSIDLSNNKLEMIEDDVFTEEFLGNSTQELILRNNQIEFITKNSLPCSLKILNLDYNNIINFEYSIFSNLINLEELTFSHNKVSSLPGLKTFENIRFIDASYNNIISLKPGEFNKLLTLEVLDLSHNKISYPLIFTNFNFPQRHPSLQISIAFNYFTHLALTDDNLRHHIVFLYGNPWDCVCWSILEKFMVDNKVKRNDCDLDFFGNGQVPYCMNYVKSNCSDTNFIQRGRDPTPFLKAIQDSLKRVKCKLKPRRL